MHRLCVTHGMWTDSRTCQGGHRADGPAQVLKEDVSSPMSAQTGAAPVLKERLLFVETTPLGTQELANQRGRLWQQGTQTFTASFTSYADKWRRLQLEVTGLYV